MQDNIKYTKVEDSLPLTGYKDDKFDGCWYEVEFYVVADGIETTAKFWACWEESIDFDEDSVFIMEFNKENVTHWAIK